jgi:hypothetical protein
MRRSTTAGLVAGILLAAVAHAGIGGPAPSGSKHLYSVPGVIHNGLVTVISCTSTLAASATANFGTATSSFLPILDGQMPGLDTLKTGSARVLSTVNNGVVCDAYAVDAINDPPAGLLQLTITGAKKRKL